MHNPPQTLRSIKHGLCSFTPSTCPFLLPLDANDYLSLAFVLLQILFSHGLNLLKNISFMKST